MAKWTPQNIRKLRKDLGLTQLEFGKSLGVTGVYIGYLEKGDKKKPSTTLQLLLDTVKNGMTRPAHPEHEQRRGKKK